MSLTIICTAWTRGSNRACTEFGGGSAWAQPPRACYEPAASVDHVNPIGGFTLHSGRSSLLRPSDSPRNGFIAGALGMSFHGQKRQETNFSKTAGQADA